MGSFWPFKSRIPLDRAIRERDYWRKAYEMLVEQTGRDLNDGWGIDPRKTAGVAPRSTPSVLADRFDRLGRHEVADSIRELLRASHEGPNGY